MASGRKPNEERRRRMAELRARGMSDAGIARLLGVSRQCVGRTLTPPERQRVFRVRCRVCDRDINPAGAVPRDDRDVLCLACLARRPHASFGEHLKAFRLAAGLKIVTLAQRVEIWPSMISSYEHGRTGTPTWRLLMRLFETLGVGLVMTPPGARVVSETAHAVCMPSAADGA